MATEAQALLRRARDEFAAGRLAASRELCDELLGREPDHAEGLHLLALLEFSAGNATAALGPIERALGKDPNDARKHQTRGLILRAQARRGEAAAAFQEAVRLSAQFPEAHGSLGLTRMEEGEFAQAARHLERALALRPGVYAWCLNLGLCRMHLGDCAGAAEAFRDAVQSNERMPEAHNNLGIAVLGSGRLAEAEASFRRCIALAPEHSHAWTNLGNVLRRTGRAREAEESYRRATQCRPALAPAWVNLGNALKEGDRLDEAMECFARALEITPDLAEAHLSRAIARLHVGDLERGWEEYRWRLGPAAAHVSRAGVEEAIGSRRPIEIRGEQGLGDALFYLRWAPALHAAGAALSFRGDRRLFPLLERTGLFEALVADEAPAGDALGLAAGDLPGVVGHRAPAHPPALPLTPSPVALEAARSLLRSAGPPPYVAVAWRAGLPSEGGSEHLHKMVPLEAMGAAVRQVPGTIVSVQREPRDAELADLARLVARPVADAGRVNDDLDGVLGLLAVLDEYAGVSSTNVHLRAGAGRHCRILVPLPPEWRYGRAGSRSPWFADSTLYRERREGGWAEAMDALALDLGAAS